MVPKIPKKYKIILSKIARISIEKFLRNDEKIIFEYKFDEFLKHRAVFVSLWKKDSKELRGCIGHIEAKYPLVEAVSKTAISAAIDDPRFEPLSENELNEIIIEINVLSNLTKILPNEIKVGKHGLYLIKGLKSSVFLPEVAIYQEWGLEKLLEELSLKAGLNKESWKNPETKILGFESESWFEN